MTSVRDILKAAARRWGLAPAARLVEVREGWAALVGPVLAEASAPLALRGRTLVVGVTSAAAAQEIRLRGARIVKSLARALREDAVSRVVPVTRHWLPRARARVPVRGSVRRPQPGR